MKFVPAVVLAIGALTSGVASAHEGHAHKIMGTVTSVHADSTHIEVKTKEGTVVTIQVTPETKYLAGSKAAALSDLVAGTRVVVTTKMEQQKTIATEIKVGAPQAGRKSRPSIATTSDAVPREESALRLPPPSSGRLRSG
jgi:hypothetical protein